MLVTDKKHRQITNDQVLRPGKKEKANTTRIVYIYRVKKREILPKQERWIQGTFI